MASIPANFYLMMSDQQSVPNFSIQKIYLKDLSFEAPNSPEMFSGTWQPEANIEMNTQFERLDEVHYEVVLHMTLTAKNRNETAFIAEVKQAGIFALINIPQEQVEPILMSYCPTSLFPYARNNLATAVFRGSFPELNLSPVNFEALYLQSKQTQVDASALN